MSFFAPRPTDTPMAESAIPASRGLEWENLERQILRAYGRQPGARGGLRVVHPRDQIYQAALAALRADDWDPNQRAPFWAEFEYRGRRWALMEPLPSARG